MYEGLTKYLDVFAEENFGEWVIDKDRVHFPYVRYTEAIDKFRKDIMAFVDGHEEMDLTRYPLILKKNGIEQSAEAMAEADPESLDGQAVMALIVASMRGERFCEGFLLRMFEEGCIRKWLMRLATIDRDAQAEK